MKRLFICLMIFMFLVTVNTSGISVYADDAKTLTLEDMTEIMLNESTDARNVELDAEILKAKYEEKIEDYVEDRDKVMKEAEGYATISWSQLKTSMEQAGKADDVRSLINAQVNNYIYYKNKYKGSVDNYVSSMKSMEPIILQLKQVEKKKDAEIEKLKLSLLKDYYELYTLEKELELAKNDLILMRSKVDAEKIKKNNGMATELDVQDLENTKISQEILIADMENTLELKRENLKTKLNMKVEDELKIDFKIPEDTSTIKYDLQESIDTFANESLDYETAKNNERVYEDASKSYTIAYTPNTEIEAWVPETPKEDKDKIKAAELEVEKAKNDTKTTKKNMDIYVKNTYFALQKANSNMALSMNTANMIKQKQMVLDANYRQGTISKLQYDQLANDYNRKMYEVKKAAINYEIAKRQMELVLKGIWIK